ncbi:hypothetical protein DV737_g5695, partial [Chaetothyriales sp. CBS 132003]
MAPDAVELPAKTGSGNVQRDDEDELYQDVVSQFPFLSGYSHVLFIFQPDANRSSEMILAALRHGFDKLVSQVPWLGGQLLHTPGPTGSSGHYSVAPWPSDAPANELIRVKHCEDLIPPMAQIMRAGAPAFMLDGKILTPFPSLPLPHGQDPPLPVINLQVNFIRGGVLLNTTTHHMAIDATGVVQIMRLLATILHGRDIPVAELEQANRDRRRVLQLIPRGEPVKDHSHLRAPPGHVTSPPSSPPKWCYFKMPVATVSTLKRLVASQQLRQVQQISVNDIISAFCWQRITAIRLARGFSPDTKTKMTRTIDARGALGVPITYIGHLTYFSVSQLPMSQVVSVPLVNIAHTLRRDLNAANTPWAIRSFATFIARQLDKSNLVYAGIRNLDTDLGTTALSSSQSGAQNESSVLAEDFGPVFGRLMCIRRPNVSPLTGGITISPVEDGAIPIVLCMPEADLEGLKKDRDWSRYMKHVG